MAIVSAVYQIVNKSNGKIYIGSSVDAYKRWRDHKASLRKDAHHSIYLQRAWHKYGESSFELSLLETVIENNLREREQHYLDTLKPEYNMCDIAKGIARKPLSENAKKKSSLSHLGNIHSEETRHKMSTARKEFLKNGGTRPWSGKQLSEEHRKKVSDSIKKLWAIRRGE